MRYPLSKKIQFGYWSLFVIFVIYYLIVKVPTNGIEMADNSIYLTSGNNYLHGVFNEYGLSSIFGAIILKISGGRYLFDMQFFYFIQFLAGLLFVIGCRLRAPVYWLTPLILAIIVGPSVNIFLGYENEGPIMLLIATSLLLMTMNYAFSSFWKNTLSILSSFFYVYSSVTNLILVPSLLVNAIILFFIYPRIRNKFFMISYLLFSALGLYLIVSRVLPLFQSTDYYQPDFIKVSLWHLTCLSGMVLAFWLSGFLTAKIMIFCAHWVRRVMWSTSVNPVTMQSGVLLIFTLWVWVALRALLVATSDSSYISMSLCHSLFFYTCLYCGGLIALYGNQCDQDQKRLQLGLAFFLLIEYFLAIAAAVEIPWSIRAHVLEGFILLVTCVWLEYLLMQQGPNILRNSILLILFFYIATHAVMHHIFISSHYVKQNHLIKITNIDRLRGVYTSPIVLNNLEQIMGVYQQYHCENKLFIERARQPFFYFLFDRAEQASFFYLNSSQDIKQLKQAKKRNGYCYMSDFAFYSISPDYLDQKKASFVALNEWLKHQSKHIIKLSLDGGCCVKDAFLIIYIG